MNVEVPWVVKSGTWEAILLCLFLSPDLYSLCAWELGTKKEYCMYPEKVFKYSRGKNEDYPWHKWSLAFLLCLWMSRIEVKWIEGTL